MNGEMSIDQALSKDEYARLIQKTIEKRILYLCQWEMTYACNLNCQHCYVAKKDAENEFNLQEAKKIIDQLKELNCLFLVLSGGEALLRKDFFEIAIYARQQDFALRIMTNATLLNKKSCIRLASLNPFSVEISIYASSSILHDQITKVKGSFEQMLTNVKRLLRLKVRVVLKFIVMKENLYDFASTFALAKSLGCDFLFDIGIAPRNDGTKDNLIHRLGKDQLKQFFLANQIPLHRINPKESIMCQAGLNNLMLSPQLDVFPCVGLRIPLGNLRQKSLREIWENSERLNSFRHLALKDFPQCQSCSNLTTCYRCPGLAYTEGEGFFAASPFDCLVANTIEEILSQTQRGDYEEKGEEREKTLSETRRSLCPKD